MTQGDLLSYRAPSVRSATSEAAARGVEPRVGTLRHRVLEYLRGCGDGATDDEMQVALAMNPSSQRPRRVELVDAGLVVDSGRERVTRGGCRAVVWVAVQR